MIEIRFGKPSISLKTVKAGEEATEKVEAPLFTKRNLIILGTGIAIGVILKQQADIRSLSRTVGHLQQTVDVMIGVVR